MTDPALVAKKLALIESCLSDLRRLAQPEAPATDVRDVLGNHLGDLEAFVGVVRRRLPSDR